MSTSESTSHAAAKETPFGSVSDAQRVLSRLTPSTPLLVDFDESLFLRNSTEEYLNTLAPAFLAVVLLKILDVVKPWRVIGHYSRDWVRVVICTLFFPWAPFVFRRRAKTLASRYLNPELFAAVTASPAASRATIVTLGFSFVVRPLLKEMGLGHWPLVCCTVSRGLMQRKRGKLYMCQQQLEARTLPQAACVTDSLDDLPLLEHVAHPVLVRWPDARYLPAHSETYLPFQYLEKGKRPGQRYFARVILYDEWLTACLAFAWLNPKPAAACVSLLLLTLSFWCIYELGYAENDRVGERFEKKPVLSGTYRTYVNSVRALPAWSWAMVFAIPGVAFSLWSTATFTPIHAAYALGSWVSVLAASRLTFYAYNYANVRFRYWLYPVLQGLKSFAPIVLLAPSLVGAMALTASIVARWFPYAIYRRGGDRKNFPEQLTRLLLFVFLCAVTFSSGMASISRALWMQFAVTSIWLLWRSRRQIGEEIRQFSTVSKS